MKNISIREMTEQDIPLVAEIERMSYTMPWSEISFQGELHSRHSTTRLAEGNGMIAGYICVRRIADECHLLNLTVRPECRRQGIATMLFEDVVRDLKRDGGRFMFLEVRESNEEARRLYERFGFNIVGTRKNYYLRPEEDAFIMMLELDYRETA